mmetsp:Transcript_41760/g.97753  ORF Transcript_41760/g.97753 Transcript_41760/m.97753 type:complete len:207 (-) Transcript_41760:684-1304(-)
MSVCLLKTVTAAVPSPDRAFFKSSKSISTSSQTCLVRTGTDEPPGMMPRRLSQPPTTSLQCFWMSSLSGMLISSSTVMGLLTWPEMQKSFVPALFLRPNEENHSGPRRMMVGATDTVSTLATVVGQPYRPAFAGNGGFSRGLPGLPSIDSIRPVSSPQMYAPPPRWRCTSKSMPVPHAFFPTSPAAYASAIAFSRTTASYTNSPRM